MDSLNLFEEVGITYIVDIGDGRTMKRHIDQLRQNVHYSPESTSNVIDDCYYSYEPVTAVQNVDPVLQPPPIPLEEERR